VISIFLSVKISLFCLSLDMKQDILYDSVANVERGLVMAAKKSIDVLIGGKVYTLCGYESEEYLQKVASYINSKIAELESMEGIHRITADMKATMISLNIADDYFKARERVDRLEEERQMKEREVYDIRHDLISAKLRSDTDAEKIVKLEQQNKELQLEVARLQAIADQTKEKTRSEDNITTEEDDQQIEENEQIEAQIETEEEQTEENTETEETIQVEESNAANGTKENTDTQENIKGNTYTKANKRTRGRRHR
jgi:cell division protein ZapA